MWSRTRRPAGTQPSHELARITVEQLEARLVPALGFIPGDLAILVTGTTSNTTATVTELSPQAADQDPVSVILIDGTGADALRFNGSSTTIGYLSRSNDNTLLAFTGANSTDTTTKVSNLTTRGVGTLDEVGSFALQTTYTGSAGQQTRSATSLDNATWFITDTGGLFTNSASAPSPAANLRAVKSFGGTVYAGQQSADTAIVQVVTVSAASGGTLTALPGLSNESLFQDFYLIRSGDNGNKFDVLYVASNSSSNTGSIAKYSLVNGSWMANGTYDTDFGGFGLAASDDGNGARLYVTTGDGHKAGNSVIRLIDTAGYNAVISINTADNLTLYTTTISTTIKGIDFVPAAAPTNNAPVLNGANNLASIDEDDTASPGTLVSDLISGQVTDDSGSLGGIAVTAVDGTNGNWQYTTDGSTWNDVGSVSDSFALLLASDANTRLRFVPAANFNGTISPAVTFRAWDQTDGTVGAKADTSTNGGSTAYSSATASSALVVNAVNDAPTVTLAMPSVTVIQGSGTATVFHFASFQPGGGTDEASQTPTYNVRAADPSLFSVQPTITTKGTLTFTPQPGSSGSTTVFVSVTDSGGATSRSEEQFTIHITALKPPGVTPPTPLPGIIAIGSDQGRLARVRILDAATGAALTAFTPFAGYDGGVQVAVGDVNGDGTDDVIVATATGAAHVKVFSQSGTLMQSFMAFRGFDGGLSLAVGDVDQDGKADIVVGTAMARSHVKVFRGSSGEELRSFLAFSDYLGGVRVAAGDVTGDGNADIAVVAGPGGNGHVKVFDGTNGSVVESFFGYADFQGEVNVAVGDVTGDGLAEVITVAQNPAHGPHIKAFAASELVVRSFFLPAGSSLSRPTEGAASNTPRLGAGDAEILLGSPPGSTASRLLVLSGDTGAVIRDQLAFDSQFTLGIFVSG